MAVSKLRTLTSIVATAALATACGASSTSTGSGLDGTDTGGTTTTGATGAGGATTTVTGSGGATTTTATTGGGGATGSGGHAGGASGVDADKDGYDANVDCDDQNADVHPGATEVCNGLDDNCDTQLDEGVTKTYYRDLDEDGYGIDDAATNVQACDAPPGYAAQPGDCDDKRNAVHPGAKEICDGIDDDCNQQIDENVQTTYYVDADGDGWGVDDPATNVETCSPPIGYAADKGDCNDADPAIHPGAAEIAGDGVDQDCVAGDSPCAAGLSECTGDTLRVCDAGGVWSAPTDCAAAGKVCSNQLGCVVCLPGTATCVGDTSHACRPDGSGYDDIVCDPVQGSSCDAQTGACSGPCSPQVLGKSYLGCDFYPTVTQQHDGYNTAPTNQYAVAVSNPTGTATDVLVTQGAQTIATATVGPNSLQIINLPWVNALTKGSGPSVLVTGGAYRLRTKVPVTVYQYNPIQATTTNDASLLLPATAWTGNYVVAAWPTWSGYPGFYAVTAREDGTTVKVTPSATGKSVKAGGGIAADGTGTVKLNRGDVLEVMSNTQDVTGTLVNADKPVQVIGGHECTDVPLNITACDHLEESMFPIETLATEYVIAPPVQVPTDSKEKAQIVRVIAPYANTTLTFDPDQNVKKVLVNAGDFTEIPMTIARFVVKADKKILVSQYMVGQDAGYGTSDPAMVLAVAPAQWRKGYLVHAPVSWLANYVDLISTTGATIKVDGAAVANWSPIGATGYSVAHVKLGNVGGGNHIILGDFPVSVAVAGLQSYGSYWYPGGLDLKEVVVP
jgi:hypothetical protein